MTGAVIAVDGTVAYRAVTFADCQELCGGYVQLINIHPGVWAYVNEDGIGSDLPRNPLATKLCRVFGPNVLMDRLGIRGVMVVVGPNGTHDLTDRARGVIDKLAAEGAS